MKVYAFVGVSGSGKSHRAQAVAKEYGLNYIIDDALLIKNNKIIAGKSAKKAETKIASVRLALFSDPAQKEEIDRIRSAQEIDSILVLGTSDGMVETIVKNLDLQPIEKIIHIEDVATKEEIEKAKNVRTKEGKHVIPVPTFEIKRDFSGYLLDSLQIFKKNKGEKPYVTEKSVIRPTFTYIGDYVISVNVFKQIAMHNIINMKEIHKVTKLEIENYSDGLFINIDVVINFGANIKKTLLKLKQNVKSDIEKCTSMNVFDVIVTAKSINMDVKNIK
ncbi:MAG: Asp23/Gls24 family envelope stress response protein [Clostridia bacterium]|nr:Asp23/Gls24 family envelope stress response protein [Clostridia bacterium]